MIKKCIIIITIFILVLISIDFIPVKFAVDGKDKKIFFVNVPKLGDASWAEIEYNNGEFNYDSMTEYIIMGNAPDKILRKKDFDKTSLFLMKGDNKNKFFIYYTEKEIVSDSDNLPVYKIFSDNWEIIYPIHRASFRRFYVSKKYLTLYDFDLMTLIMKKYR